MIRRITFQVISFDKCLDDLFDVFFGGRKATNLRNYFDEQIIDRKTPPCFHDSNNRSLHLKFTVFNQMSVNLVRGMKRRFEGRTRLIETKFARRKRKVEMKDVRFIDDIGRNLLRSDAEKKVLWRIDECMQRLFEYVDGNIESITKSVEANTIVGVELEKDTGLSHVHDDSSAKAR